MKKLLIFAIMMLLFIPQQPVFAINAVASIKNISGEVKIQRLKRNIPGRRGLVLKDQDVVITGYNAKTTILFRDGSEIRLYPNTRFIIEKTVELEGSQRGFFNNLILKTGSFWGNFTKKKQRTKIVTPTATCGIKGTSVSFSERNGKLDVSLSTGVVELENEDEKILLPPGKMVRGITQTGNFSDKMEDLPFRLIIKPDNKHIKLPTLGNTEKVDFTIQIINTKTKQNVPRSGIVFFSLKSDKMVFPSNIRLNDRGYARVSATIKPFQKADYGNGRMEIVAVAEGEAFMDVGTGETVLTYNVPKKFRKTIHIDATSGKIN